MAFGARSARPALTLLAVAAVVLGGLADAPAQAAAARPGATPGVARAHGATAGSLAVRLSWHNPAAAGRRGTVVRYAEGTRAPASPGSGRSGGRSGVAAQAITVADLRPSTRYAFALFAAYGAGRFGPRAVVRLMTAPDFVHLVQPFARGSHVTLTWVPPRAATYRTTVVRYAASGQPPASPTAGTGVAVSNPHAATATVGGLTPGRRYAVSIWTRDRAGHYSSRAISRFTLPTAPAAGPSGRFQGTVTDAGHHPLAGVHVIAFGNYPGASPQTTTGTDGHYSFVAPAGAQTLIFSGADATGGTSDATGYSWVVRPLTLRPGSTMSESAALDPAGAVEGQVTDVHGNPLAGVSLYLQQPQPYVANYSFSFYDISGAPTTGADGRFRLKGLPPDAALLCYDTSLAPVTGGATDAAGYLSRCEHRSVAVGPGDTRTLPAAVLLAASTGVVTGTIRDAAGHPVANAVVNVGSHDPRGGLGGSTTADGSGRYRVGGLLPGRYDVCAEPSAGPSAGPVADALVGALTCRFAVVQVRAGQVGSVDLRLRAAGAVSGRLRAASGAPVVQALVAAVSQGGAAAAYAVTDARGQFVLGDLAAGRYRICYDPSDATVAGAAGGVLPGCRQGGDLVQVRAGAVRVGADAVLGAGGSITGRVTGLSGGSGSGSFGADAWVEVVQPGADQSTAIAQIADDGTFVATGIPAGRYLVCAQVISGNTEVDSCYHAPGRAGTTEVRVRTGRVTRSIDMALPPRAAVTASITDAGGQPIGGVDVVVVRACSQDEGCDPLPLFDGRRPVTVVASGMTDAAGQVHLDYLPPSGPHYAVCAFAFYGAAATGDPATGYLDRCTGSGSFGVVAPAGRSTPVALALHPAGAVRGRVLDRGGHPLAGVRIVVSGSSSTDYYPPATGDLSGPGFDFGGQGGPADDAVTEADGSYLVPGVQPGNRSVCFDPSNAVDASGAPHRNGLLGQCVGGAPGSTTGGTPVTVPAAGTVTVPDQQLADAAGLAGRVLDAATGRGIGGADVLVFVGQDLVAASATDGGGRYRLAGLAPATARVCFAAYPYRPQCYDGVAWPGKTVPTAATPVTLTPAATQTLKDARLRRG